MDHGNEAVSLADNWKDYNVSRSDGSGHGYKRYAMSTKKLSSIHDKSQKSYQNILQRLADDPAAVQVAGGLPMEITQRLIDSGTGLGTAGKAGSYVFTSQQEFKYLLLEMLEEAGVNFLFHSLVVDVWRCEDKGVMIGAIKG